MKNKTTINILAGGPIEDLPVDLFFSKKNDRWIGVDRGSIELIRHGITPEICLGDFDSLSAKELQDVENSVSDIRYAIPEKDFTDTEMALLIANYDLYADNINLYGATGGRLDHLLVNLFTILKPQNKPLYNKLTIIDKGNVIFFVNPGRHVLKKLPEYKYISFVNLTQINNFNIYGAKYPLENFSSNFPVSLSSNEFLTDSISIQYDEGKVAVIYSRD